MLRPSLGTLPNYHPVAAILVRMGAKEKKGRKFLNRYGQAIRWWGVKQNFL